MWEHNANHREKYNGDAAAFATVKRRNAGPGFGCLNLQTRVFYEVGYQRFEKKWVDASNIPLRGLIPALHAI